MMIESLKSIDLEGADVKLVEYDECLFHWWTHGCLPDSKNSTSLSV